MKEKRLYFASLSECNQDCVFCVRGGKSEKIKYIDTEQSKRVLKSKRKEGFEVVNFDGGEPTLRPDLVELIGYARKVGYKNVIVLTNGVLLANDKLIQKINSIDNFSDFLSFSVSLHSHCEQTSDKITSRGGTFRKTIQGIRNLIKIGARLSIYHAITIYNYEKLEGFVKFVSSNFPQIKSITFSFLYPTGAVLENPSVYPKLSLVEPFFLKAADMCRKEGIEFFLTSCGTVPLCFLGDYKDLLIKQQELDRPEKVGIVDSKGEFQSQLAAESFHKATKIKSEKCQKCFYSNKCAGLWKEYARLYGVDELRPYLSADKMAPFKKDKNLTIKNKVSEPNDLKEPKKTFLLFITPLCNNNCIFCSTSGEAFISREGSLETEYLKNKTKEAKKGGFDKIEFIGGEVTLREDLVELIKFAKNEEFERIAMTTNGRRLCYFDYTRQLREAGLSDLVISLYGSNATRHDGATRTPGSFYQTIQGIRNALKAGFESLAINTVIWKGNFQNLEELGELIYALGVREWHILRLLPEGRGKNFLNLAEISYDELILAVNGIVKFKNKFDNIVFFDFEKELIGKFNQEIKNGGKPFSLVSSESKRKQVKLIT